MHRSFKNILLETKKIRCRLRYTERLKGNFFIKSEMWKM
jgi:hypothetical protein